MTLAVARYSLACVVVCGLAIRLWTVAERSFWYDEAFAYTLAHDFSWSEMLRRTAADYHPPFFFGIFRLWIGFAGTSVVGMRMFSVFWSAITMIGCFVFFRDVFSPRENCSLSAPLPADEETSGLMADARWMGISAAALVGACSIHIKWSQEVKMYTLGTALAMFSTWMLVRAVRSSVNCIWWWSGYTVCAIAFEYTHNFALFSVLGQSVFCIGVLICKGVNGRRHIPCAVQFAAINAIDGVRNVPAAIITQQRRTTALADLTMIPVGDGSFAMGCPSGDRRSPWSYAIVAFVTIAVAYLPWGSVLMEQTHRGESQFWTPAITSWSIPDCMAGLVVPMKSSSDEHAVSVVVTGVLLCILGLLCWRARFIELLLLVMVVTPIACAAVISCASVQIFVSRYFLFSYIFALCAVVRILARFVPAPYRTVVVALLVSTSLADHERYWISLQTATRPGIHGAIEHVIKQRNTDDVIVVLHPAIYLSARYYLNGIAEPRLFLPKGWEPHYMGGPGIASEWRVNVEQLQDPAIQRIWVLETTGFLHRFERPVIPPEWQRVPGSTAIFQDVYDFQGVVTAAAYVRHSTLTDSTERK